MFLLLFEIIILMRGGRIKVPFWIKAMLLGGLFAGGVLGTACGGGLLSFLLWRPRKKLLSLILGFQRELMLVIVLWSCCPNQ